MPYFPTKGTFPKKVPRITELFFPRVLYRSWFLHIPRRSFSARAFHMGCALRYFSTDLPASRPVNALRAVPPSSSPTLTRQLRGDLLCLRRASSLYHSC